MSRKNTERSELAAEMVEGLDEGFHYSVLAYTDENDPIEVAWNYESGPGAPYPNDDFTDRELSEHRRQLAIEHQQQYEDDEDDEDTETEQAKLITDGGTVEDRIDRLNESNAERRACKLGTKSTTVWIYEGDLPLSKGDVIRYAEKSNQTPKKGRVIADPEERYLFIGVDPTTPLMDDPCSTGTAQSEEADRDV